MKRIPVGPRQVFRLSYRGKRRPPLDSRARLKATLADYCACLEACVQGKVRKAHEIEDARGEQSMHIGGDSSSLLSLLPSAAALHAVARDRELMPRLAEHVCSYIIARSHFEAEAYWETADPLLLPLTDADLVRAAADCIAARGYPIEAILTLARDQSDCVTAIRGILDVGQAVRRIDHHDYACLRRCLPMILAERFASIDDDGAEQVQIAAMIQIDHDTNLSKFHHTLCKLLIRTLREGDASSQQERYRTWLIIAFAAIFFVIALTAIAVLAVMILGEEGSLAHSASILPHFLRFF